jgi:hypothetical protein
MTRWDSGPPPGAFAGQYKTRPAQIIMRNLGRWRKALGVIFAWREAG